MKTPLEKVISINDKTDEEINNLIQRNNAQGWSVKIMSYGLIVFERK